jgi:hypothetical protein
VIEIALAPERWTVRTANLTVQIWSRELRVNYRQEVRLVASNDWRTLEVDFSKFATTDASRAPPKVYQHDTTVSIRIY